MRTMIKTSAFEAFILFTIDHPNLIEATQVLLLNGFLKKSTKDYKKQIEIADKIIQSLSK